MKRNSLLFSFLLILIVENPLYSNIAIITIKLFIQQVKLPLGTGIPPFFCNFEKYILSDLQHVKFASKISSNWDQFAILVLLEEKSII